MKLDLSQPEAQAALQAAATLMIASKVQQRTDNPPPPSPRTYERPSPVGFDHRDLAEVCVTIALQLLQESQVERDELLLPVQK